MDKKVLTPEEVARQLGISRNLVYDELRAGKIPHVKVGDRYLIPCSAFEKWLLECNHNKLQGINEKAG